MVYDIYMEGYVISGNSAGPRYIGTAEGKNLQDAVKNWYSKNGTDEDKKYLSTDYTSYWGCRFFTINKRM